MAMSVGVIGEGCVPIAKTGADSEKEEVYSCKVLLYKIINKKTRPAQGRTGRYFFKMKSRFFQKRKPMRRR
jgi:hypothetical protein